MKNCSKKACLISSAAVFVFLYVYEWFVHGKLLMGMYQETASVWRPMAEMQAMMPWVLVKYVVFALLFTCMFKKCRMQKAACDAAAGTAPSEKDMKCPIKSGTLCFGVTLGLILGICSASMYPYLPIPGSLAVAWFFTGLFEGIGVALVLHLTCKKGDAA